MLCYSLRTLSMRHVTDYRPGSVEYIVSIPLWSSRRCTLCAQFMIKSAVDHLIWIEWKSKTSPPAFISSCLRILQETLNKEVWNTACCNYQRNAMTYKDLHCLSKSLSLSKYKTVRHLHFWKGRMKGRWPHKCIFQGGRCVQLWPSKISLLCLGQL